MREDLLANLTTMAHDLEGDLGIVLRELISEAAHDPALGAEFQTRFGQGKERGVVVMIQRAMARGEIPVQPIDPYVLQVPAAMVVHQVVLTGRPPTADELHHIIDAIVLPLLRQPVVV